MKVTTRVCDVCGEKAGSSWSQTILINGDVDEEYLSPPNLDLCERHRDSFTWVSKKWKQPRHDTYKLSEQELRECVGDIKTQQTRFRK